MLSEFVRTTRGHITDRTYPTERHADDRILRCIQIPAPALLGNLSGLIGAPNTSYTGVIQSFSFRHALSDGAPYCLAPNIALPMRTIVLPHSTARR